MFCQPKPSSVSSLVKSSSIPRLRLERCIKRRNEIAKFRRKLQIEYERFIINKDEITVEGIVLWVCDGSSTGTYGMTIYAFDNSTNKLQCE